MTDRKAFEPIETERLLLRPFQTRDVQSFSDYRSDPDVARYQGWDAPYSLAKAERFVAEIQAVHPGKPDEWYQAAIELKAEGILIGDIGFKVLYDGRQGEIGFTLATKYQGKGYAFEAVEQIMNYMFAEFDLHRIQANSDPRNLPSIRLMERLNMRREGHMIENIWYKGEWADEFWYAILRREWEAR